jgi:hypothetical protein
MRRRASWPQAAALLAAGALAVHELRYLLAFGPSTQHALARDGHAYLSFVHPLVALLVAAVIARLVLVLARGGGGGASPRPTTFARMWASASAALLAIYALQELVEGELAPGHASGLAAVASHGGWLAVPAALVVGALVAVFLREAPRAAARAQAIATSRTAAPTAIVVRLPAAPAPARPALLARHLAGRAPPLAT